MWRPLADERIVKFATLQGTCTPPTHSCGWDVWNSEKYKQKDYAPIDKEELESLKRFIGRKAEKGLGEWKEPASSNAE